MSSKFSKAHILQQPEYRFLVNKDTGHFIQTCLEDGQVKLRLGHKPDSPGDNLVRLSHQGARKGKEGLSHTSVYHLTGRGYTGLTDEQKKGETSDVGASYVSLAVPNSAQVSDMSPTAPSTPPSGRQSRIKWGNPSVAHKTYDKVSVISKQEILEPSTGGHTFLGETKKEETPTDAEIHQKESHISSADDHQKSHVHFQMTQKNRPCDIPTTASDAGTTSKPFSDLERKRDVLNDGGRNDKVATQTGYRGGLHIGSLTIHEGKVSDYILTGKQVTRSRRYGTVSMTPQSSAELNEAGHKETSAKPYVHVSWGDCPGSPPLCEDEAETEDCVKRSFRGTPVIFVNERPALDSSGYSDDVDAVFVNADYYMPPSQVPQPDDNIDEKGWFTIEPAEKPCPLKIKVEIPDGSQPENDSESLRKQIGSPELRREFWKTVESPDNEKIRQSKMDEQRSKEITGIKSEGTNGRGKVEQEKRDAVPRLELGDNARNCVSSVASKIQPKDLRRGTTAAQPSRKGEAVPETRRAAQPKSAVTRRVSTPATVSSYSFHPTAHPAERSIIAVTPNPPPTPTSRHPGVKPGGPATPRTAKHSAGSRETRSGKSRRWTVAASSATTSGEGQISRQVSWAKENAQNDGDVSKGHNDIGERGSAAFHDGRTVPWHRSAQEITRRVTVHGLPRPRDAQGHAESSDFDSDSLSGSRRVSTVSGPSRRTSHVSTATYGDIERPSAAEFARQASQYDPKAEKSQTFNHQRDNTFTKASQYLTPVRRGLRNLQVHYSQTNTAHNDGLIFAHLLRASHVKNAVVEEGVYTLERRLYTRRNGATPHATTFYDTENELKTNRASKSAKTVYGTVATKKKERRDRIKKKNDQLEMGYTPRALSLTPLGPEDMDKLLDQCRHLRVDPSRQQHLYRTDIDYWNNVMKQRKDGGNVMTSVQNASNVTSSPRPVSTARV